MYIDTHLHLSGKDYDCIETVVENARKKNVNYLIVSCCTMSDIEEGIKLISKFDNIFLSIGLHPSEAKKYTLNDIKIIKQYIINNRNRIVAVGEIGLDYHYGKEDILLQKKLFISQLDLANKLKIPVVIHTRDAVYDTIEILKNYNLNGVIHCFNGSVETANIYIKMGYKLGIGGVVTFKNSKLGDVIKNIGSKAIVLETDSPYLSPEPYRGIKNEPKNIPVIAKKISDILNVSIDKIAEETTINAIRLFDLNIQL